MSNPTKLHNFNDCIFVLDDENDDVETKQTYVSQYENLQISAISQPGEKFSDGAEHSGNRKERELLCIIKNQNLHSTRCCNAKKCLRTYNGALSQIFLCS